MAEIWDENILEKPNWAEHIHKFFDETDIGCMAAPSRAIDLRSYYGVRLNAERIHFHVERGSMPPQPDRRWSAIKVKNFYNWMAAGYPKEESQFRIFKLDKPSEPRLRRNLRDYESDAQALDTLKRAFRGLMKKDLDDPRGYYQIAGIHWLPAPALYCRHHENAYNPWHRAYLLAFEDAMRRIEGCEEVTLPYWDIQDDHIPAFIWDEPFADYEFRTDVVDSQGNILATAGDRTERQDRTNLITQIRDRVDSSRGLTIDGYIRKAVCAPRWQGFNGWSGRTYGHDGIIMAHDLGHVRCGTDTVTDVTNGTVNRSLAEPNFAAFDPLFWFFHCNWDRLWWHWQTKTGATTVETFRKLAESEDDPTTWIDDPVISMLQPFGVFTKDMIDCRAWKINYAVPEKERAIEPMVEHFGRMFAASSPRVSDASTVSVRIKGINRLAIPGSFDVELLADEDVVATTYVFQSQTPHLCPSCTKSGRFSVDFLVESGQIAERFLDVRIRCRSVTGLKVLSPEEFGSPTINARLLLS